MWIFNLIFIELLSETLVHFPLLRGIFVTWLWTTKAFPSWFYCLYSCPDEVAISQDALLCLQGASCTPRTGSTCSSSRSLTTFFPLPGGLFSVPQNNCLSSTLETQFVLSPLDFSSTVGPRCVSCSQIVFISMTLCNSEQPSAPLVSDLCLHSSAVRTPQLWGNLYCGSHSFTEPVFTERLLCARHGFKVLN